MIIVILSLHLIGIINIKFLNYEKRVQTDIKRNFFSPALIGMAFAFGWTPCIGPILGSILVLASTEESLQQGILLLTFYSIGLAVPFILSGYLIQRFLVFSKNFRKVYSIEAAPRIFRLLRFNCENFKNIKTFNFAVSDNQKSKFFI